VFPAPSKSFERRTARAGGGERRPLPANRFSRRHEPIIRIDIGALALAGLANGTNGFSVGLPESAFCTSSGEQVRFMELPPEDATIDDGRLDAGPDASAALTPRLARRTSRRTKLALFASVALHLLAAASLITWMRDDGARIEGGTPNEIAGIGNAAMDQIASGEAVNVTIITIPIVKARSVEVESLQAAIDPARPVEEIAAAEPVQETTAEAAPVKEAEPAEEPVAVAQVSVAPEASGTVRAQANAAPVETEAATSVSDAPEILAAPALSDSADAAPAATALAEAAPEPASQAVSRPVETVRAEDTPPAETMTAEDGLHLAEHAPLPTPRPERTEQPVEKAKKQISRPERKKPARTAVRTSAPGSGGSDSADARRGVTEGRRDGRSASSNDNSQAVSAAGNAAVSNYPGKIVAKLRRALRYPSGARGRRLNGVAQVRFVVGRSGDVGSVGLAASSGSPILDEAALATVHRAAPFPPIPEGAGRSNWTFTVPLAFVR
jgi:protein TonB